MIERIIEDINGALNAEAYLAALALALTLPDICARAEYGASKGSRRRYIDWFDEYIGKFEEIPTGPSGIKMPYLSGEVVYQLRCSMLHQGTPSIEKDKIKEDSCKIDQFTLVIEKRKTFDIYTDASCAMWCEGSESDVTRSYYVNVQRLCLIITLAAQKYYQDCGGRFDFFDCKIIDGDTFISK